MMQTSGDAKSASSVTARAPLSVSMCIVCDRTARGMVTFQKKFLVQVALFYRRLRVSGCGLFFARAIAVSRSSSYEYWELCGGNFVGYL